MLVAINAMHNNLNRATNQPQMFLSTKNPSQTYSENSFGGINLSRRWEKETGFYKEIKAAISLHEAQQKQIPELNKNTSLQMPSGKRAI